MGMRQVRLPRSLSTVAPPSSSSFTSTSLRLLIGYWSCRIRSTFALPVLRTVMSQPIVTVRLPPITGFSL